MERLIYFIMLVGQFVFFYIFILDIRLRKLGKWYSNIFLIIFFLSGVIVGLDIYGSDKMAIIVSITVPLMLNCSLKKSYGLLFPTVGLCLSLNSVWNYFIYDIQKAELRDIKRLMCLFITYIGLGLIYLIKKNKKLDFGKIQVSKTEMIILNSFTLIIGVSMGTIGRIQKNRQTSNSLFFLCISDNIIVFTGVLPMP